MGYDQPLAPQFGPVGHQRPVAEVVLHRLFEEIAFADEEVRAIGDRPEGIGPFGIPGIGDDLPRASDPVGVGGGAAAVDHPDGKDGQIPQGGDRTFGQFHIIDGEFPLDRGRSGIEDLHCLADALFQARGAGDEERGFTAADELGVDDEKGDAAEMVPVEMGDQDAIDCCGADPRVFHRDQRRGAAVDEEADSTGIDMDARLEPAPAPEVVSAAQKTDTDILCRRGRGVAVRWRIKLAMGDVPLVFPQSDRFLFIKHDPFGFQQGALKVLRLWVGAKTDLAFPIYDPLPGNPRPLGEAVKGVTDLPGMTGHAGQACDLSVGGDFAAGNVVHDFVYARIKCVFSHRRPSDG